MMEQKQLENVEYFNHLGSMTTKDARCTREIKSRTAMAKAAFNINNNNNNNNNHDDDDSLHERKGLKSKEGNGTVLDLEYSFVMC
jgi:hypothetical protein